MNTKENKMDAGSFVQLVDRIGYSECCGFCNKQDFKSWSNLNSEMSGKLRVIAEFEHAEQAITSNGYSEFHPKDTNYWSSDAPIALYFYPYHESTIKCCPKCEAVFLVYTDYAGHGPQVRVRYVDKQLIILTKKVDESKGK